MPGYVALPAYRPQGAINFDPLNEGLDDLSKQFEKNRLLRQAQQIGAALAPDTATQTTPNALMAPSNVPASPAQASAAAAGRIIGAESGGDPNARNPNSSATGAGQFINSTWLDTVKRNRPDLASGKSDAEILSLRSNTNLSREMTDAYAAQNSKLLQGAGFASTPGNTYLAHFAGPGGASAVLRADPSTPVTQILSPAAIAANPHIANMTAGDLRSWADRKMGGAPATSAQAQAAPAPSGPNYRKAAAKAFEYGNIALGTQFLQQQQELDNQAYTRGRQARQDVREEQTFKDAHLKAVAAHVGNMANTVALEPDKAKQTAMWRSMVATDPEIAQGLQQNGIDPNDVESGTRFMINQARGITEKLGKDRYVVAGKRVFDTATQQFISSPDGTTGDDEKYAKQITYGLDEQGNVVALQAGDNATLAASKLPAGIKIAGKDPIRLDGGDRWILLDPVTRGKIGEIMKNVAAEAQQKEAGKSEAERQFNKPQAQLTAETAISNLDRVKQEIATLKGMPALSSATGNLQSRLPNVWQSTADADSSIRNLKGKLATTALQAMRDASKTGGAVGSVTEREWPILESMIGNLDPSQGDATFVARLGEIENYLEGAKARISGAYQQTYGEPPVPQGGNQPAAPVQGAAPRATNKATGQVLELNPQTNQWEAVQ